MSVLAESWWTTSEARVAQPAIDVGRGTAEVLPERALRPSRTHRVEQFEPPLVVRGSTGPPPT